MSTQFMNFHFSAFKFIELLSNGSLEWREAREYAAEADGKEFVFTFSFLGQSHKTQSTENELFTGTGKKIPQNLLSIPLSLNVNDKW